MNAELRPDLCIIGGGPGGISLALGAAACGLSVVLVEKGALGGRRLRDTIPRHVLLAAARATSSVRRAADFGIAGVGPWIDFAHLRKHTAAVLAAISPGYSQARLEAANVTVIRAPGRFTGPDSCEAGGKVIKARHFVVATGSVDRSLPIPGLELVRPLDCAALCALEQLPRSLTVVGDDPDALALAQALRRLGCEVTILIDGELLSSQDGELAAPVRAAFARDGLAVYERVRILRIEPRGEDVRVLMATAGHEKSILGSHILIGVGRAPAIGGLGLGLAGVRYDENGIETVASLATSNKRIYAIGAAVKGSRPDGAAERDAFLVLHAIRGLRRSRVRPHAEPRVLLTSPAIATAGLSEDQARAAHRRIQILRWPFAETGRARIEHCSTGHLKLITSEAGTILGAAIVGERAEELISIVALAISKGVTVGDLSSIITPYPALSGAVQSAAMMFRESRLEAPLRRFLLAANQEINRTMLELKKLRKILEKEIRYVFRGPK